MLVADFEKELGRSPPTSPNGDFEEVPSHWRRASKFHPGPPGEEVTSPDSPLTPNMSEKRARESVKISKKMGGIDIPDSWLLNRRESTESIGEGGMSPMSPGGPGSWLREDSKEDGEEDKDGSKNKGKSDD